MSNLKERQRKTMVKVSALRAQMAELTVRVERLEKFRQSIKGDVTTIGGRGVPSYTITKGGIVEFNINKKKPTVKKVAKKKVARKRS